VCCKVVLSFAPVAPHVVSSLKVRQKSVKGGLRGAVEEDIETMVGVEGQVRHSKM
jgi:hypothetical protein